MDDHMRKLNTKIRNKEAELNALYTKIQKLEKDIAISNHKKLVVKKSETAENDHLLWRNKEVLFTWLVATGNSVLID